MQLTEARRIAVIEASPSKGEINYRVYFNRNGTMGWYVKGSKPPEKIKLQTRCTYKESAKKIGSLCNKLVKENIGSLILLHQDSTKIDKRRIQQIQTYRNDIRKKMENKTKRNQAGFIICVPARNNQKILTPNCNSVLSNSYKPSVARKVEDLGAAYKLMNKERKFAVLPTRHDNKPLSKNLVKRILRQIDHIISLQSNTIAA